MLKNYFSMGLFVLLVCQQKYLKLDKCFGVKSFVESVNGFNILRWDIALSGIFAY